MTEEDTKQYNHITPESILDKMAQDVADRKKFDAIAAEDLEDYKNAINRIFSSEDGKFFKGTKDGYASLY